MKFFLIFTLLLLTFPSAIGASLGVNEVLVRLQSALENKGELNELISNLDDLESKDLQALLKEVDPTWHQLKTSYLKTHRDHLEKSHSGEMRRETKSRIRKNREEFMTVYQKGEAAMKPLLKSTSMPAVKALRQLLLPTPDELLEAAPVQLKTQREMVLKLAKFRDAIVETAILPDEEKAVDFITTQEIQTATSFLDLPHDGLRILGENEKIAEKANVPKEEREGIRELNEWRLLLGLNALLIDPKLCDASRGHSEDMNKHGFFAHQSPLPGKTTPWDRAAKAGTKASGENIFMGSSSPQSANKGWFYSPGHHKNMFKASHTYIGLGRYQGHWTQMFR